ncbi:MAG: ABC transporter substrate-binding protein [Patescibacteria group bacterium]
MSKKTKIIWLIIALVVIIAIIGYALALTNKANSQDTEPIKIGVIAPLTGDLVNWGGSMKGGIEIAVKEWNDRGGINGQQIQLIFEDNKTCDKTEAVTAFNKLISVDKVKATMVGCSGSVLATAPIAEQSKVILLTTLASAAKISQAGNYIFRTCISDAVQGANLADFLYHQLNTPEVAVIYASNDYGVGFFDNFKSTYEASGGKILDAETYLPEATDFRTALTKIKEKNPTSLVIISYGSEGGLIAKQARELGINAQIIGSDNFGVKEVVTAGDSAAEGAIFITSALDDQNQKVKDLKTKYISAYNQDPPIMSAVANSYDGTNLLLNAIKSSGYNPDGVKNYLYGVKNYDGVSGPITIDSNGDSHMTSMMQQIKNGQFVPYQN